MQKNVNIVLRKNNWRIEGAGDGIFIVFLYQPSEKEEKEIVELAERAYQDVQWCPTPESHRINEETVYAVLNCFYERRN